MAALLSVSLSDKSIKKLGAGLAFGNLDGVAPIEPGVYLVTDWASGPLYRVDAQGNVVRLLNLHQGTADLTILPESKTILIPMMLDNALVAYRKSLEIATSIVDEFGETRQSLRDLSVSLCNLGDAELAEGRRTSATVEGATVRVPEGTADGTVRVEFMP